MKYLMIKSRFTFMTALICVAAAGSGMSAFAAEKKAETDKSVNGGKYAVFDLKRALAMSNAGRERLKDFESQKDVAEDLKKLDSMKQELHRKQEEYEKEKATWSSDQLASHQKDFDYDMQNFRMLAQKLNDKRDMLLQKIGADMDEPMKKAVDRIATQQHILILLRPEAVWSAEPDADITDEVIAELNKGTK